MIKPQGAAEKFKNSFAGLIIFLAFIFSSAGYSDTRVRLILSDNNVAHQRLAQSIKNALSRNSHSDIQLEFQALGPKTVHSAPKTQPDLIVAIGSTATRFALSNYQSTPVVSTFITRDKAHKLLESGRVISNSPDSKIIGAIVLDQPALRLMRLARLINPNATNIGALTGPLSNTRTAGLKSAAGELGLSLYTKQLKTKDNPVIALENIMSDSQAYLVLPDSSEFNRLTAKWIIYLGYRYRIPIIGYSARYADAGALVSIFSTPEQIGRQTAELVQQQVQGRPIETTIQAPAYFNIRINDKVKRSLGLTRLNEETLEQTLLVEERSPKQLKHKRASKPRGLGD